MAAVAAARRRTFQNPTACSGAAKYTAHALPHLLAGCADRDANVRQCSVYGLGVLAQLRPQAFAPHLPAALRAILAIVAAPDARCARPHGIETKTR